MLKGPQANPEGLVAEPKGHIGLGDGKGQC